MAGLKRVPQEIRTKKFFQDNPTEETPSIDRKFRPKSSWRPPVPNKTLETYYRAIKNDLIKESMKYHKIGKDNLSKEDRMFLKNIKANPEVVIKKAESKQRIIRGHNEYTGLPQRRL
jgi:hypothetical protein